MITPDIVEHVAKLARLHLSDEERAVYTQQLAKILGYFDELKQVDTANVEPMAHALPVLNVMREDEPISSAGHDEMLRNAPHREGAFFRVPRIGD